MESRAGKLRCPNAAAEGRSGELSRTHAVDRVGSRRSGGTFQFASAAPQALRACVGLPRLKSARHFASLLCLQLHESGLAWTGVGRGKESACRAEGRGSRREFPELAFAEPGEDDRGGDEDVDERGSMPPTSGAASDVADPDGGARARENREQAGDGDGDGHDFRAEESAAQTGTGE